MSKPFNGTVTSISRIRRRTGSGSPSRFRRRCAERALRRSRRESSGYVRPVNFVRLDPVTVPCHECGVDLAADSPELRLELTCDDEPIVYCKACWQREFGES